MKVRLKAKGVAITNLVQILQDYINTAKKGNRFKLVKEETTNKLVPQYHIPATGIISIEQRPRQDVKEKNMS